MLETAARALGGEFLQLDIGDAASRAAFVTSARLHASPNHRVEKMLLVLAKNATNVGKS